MNGFAWTGGADGWALLHRGRALLSQRPGKPAFYAGRGEETVWMNHGNFRLEDHVTERIPLYADRAETGEDGTVRLRFGGALEAAVELREDSVRITFDCRDAGVDRFWIRVEADPDEHCWGCGEQMSYFDLRGRHYPLWTSEPGVGRDKSTWITWMSDTQNGGAGGDYYNTNFPQPTYVSSRGYFLHAGCTAYADFDFRRPDHHELQFWAVPRELRLECAEHLIELPQRLTALLGRQPRLPEWALDGMILGLQGGSERVLGLMERSLEHGIRVAGIWCQDWAGVRYTSFGKRLNWDWHANEQLYPRLRETVGELHARGIRFLGYLNPYLVRGGDLYAEALEKGCFARKHDGSVYHVDFGEFECGVIDLSDPEAFGWFRDRVIRGLSLDLGIDGWMADFGEYLPVDDIVLGSGASPMLEHNLWPTRWAQCNLEAVRDAGRLGDVLWFMRAGGAGSPAACPALWAGDQSVDFSRHDGVCTVICAALSAGMSGCGLSHFDIGGYTSLFGNCRTKEVFLRSAEMAAFTPVMRSHEGNRPDENFQYYDDGDCMDRLARLVRVHAALKDYISPLVDENAEKGVPVQRPLFLHYEGDERCMTEQFEYLLGPDLLVAPVWQAEQTERTLYLPRDSWVHLWSGREFGGGEVTVPAPLGEPPVFFRKDSPRRALFEAAARAGR